MPRHGVSHGDAQAVFEEGAGAGALLRKKGNVKFGTPGDLNLRASIRPFSGTVLDGRHYCAEDWHVILIAYITDDSGRNSSFTKQDAEDELNPLVINFTLDGQALEDTKRTGVKNVPDVKQLLPPQAGVTQAYFIQQGRLMSPQELVVGEHTLSFTATGPDTNDADGITFSIDAPGTGACND